MLAQSGFQRLRAASPSSGAENRTPAQFGALIDRVREESAPLVMRELSRSGEFVRTFSCKSGAITVLDAASEGSLVPFHNALTGHHSVEIVSLRTEGRELFPSEICIVDRISDSWGRITLREALIRAGAPERLISPTLLFLGLEAYSTQSVVLLDDCEQQRLAIACALFSRCSVVYLGNPFARLTTAWVERVSSLLAESAHSSNHIFVAFNVERLPQAWKSSPVVHRQTVGPWRKRGLSLRSAADPLLSESVDKARLMMQSSRRRAVSSSTEWFMTRPQAIRPTRSQIRVRRDGEVVSEAIPNPLLDSSSFRGLGVAKLFHRADGQQERVRRKTGKLTRVSRFERLWGHTAAYRLYRRLTARRAIVDPVALVLAIYFLDKVIP